MKMENVYPKPDVKFYCLLLPNQRSTCGGIRMIPWSRRVMGEYEIEIAGYGMAGHSVKLLVSSRKGKQDQKQQADIKNTFQSTRYSSLKIRKNLDTQWNSICLLLIQVSPFSRSLASQPYHEVYCQSCFVTLYPGCQWWWGS